MLSVLSIMLALTWVWMAVIMKFQMLLLLYDFFFFFSSSDQKGHLRYCHHLAYIHCLVCQLHLSFPNFDLLSNSCINWIQHDLECSLEGHLWSSWFLSWIGSKRATTKKAMPKMIKFYFKFDLNWFPLNSS